MAEAHQRQEHKQQPEKKKKGSFRISQEAMQILIENKATAWQIGAYLVLARHTDESGKFTTASHKKIYSATGASPGTEKVPGKGRQIVKELMQMSSPPIYDSNGVMATTPHNLLYTAQEWQNNSGELIPETQHKLYPVVFVLNDFSSEEWVWFPNVLVDGHGRFKQPLKRLKQSGDAAARLLLLSYSASNLEEYGGIPPLNNFYYEYTLNNHIKTSYGFTFHTATIVQKHAYNTVSLQALGLKSFSEDNEQKSKQLKVFWDALAALESQGFLYEIVTAMDGHPSSADARPVYELQNKASHANTGEEGLALRIDRIISKLLNDGKEYHVADKLGRFYRGYPVISREGVTPHVVGIYRLRFRISNPKNYTVQASWNRIQNDRREWELELDHLENIVGITNKAHKVSQSQEERIFSPSTFQGETYVVPEFQQIREENFHDIYKGNDAAHQQYDDLPY